MKSQETEKECRSEKHTVITNVEVKTHSDNEREK